MTKLDEKLIKIKNEVVFKATLSRGPGGQNVNKVSSAALLYWPYRDSHLFTIEEKNIIQQKLTNKINNENLVYVFSDEFRDLEKNKSRALEKLGQWIRAALHKNKVRRPTKPTKASKVKKQKHKTQHSQVKKNRQKINW